MFFMIFNKPDLVSGFFIAFRLMGLLLQCKRKKD